MNPTTPKLSPTSLHGRKLKIARMAGARRSKRGAPSTPILQWKLEDNLDSDHNGGRDRLQFPARKLAAGLWQFHYNEISGGGVKPFRRGTHIRREFQEGEVSHRYRESKNGRAEAEHGLQSPQSFVPPNNGIQPKAAAAKWDAETSKTAEEMGRFYNQRELPEEQPLPATSVVSCLKEKLSVAQKRICKLESGQQHSQKKVEHLKKKLEEDRSLWRSRRQLKFDAEADELDRERKTRTKIEILNASLVKELADTKLYARKYKQEYVEEKRSRELTEEVCAELAKQILEDKAKTDTLKGESARLREELEEERKMLQMAEVWREERIQMKLIDAKLALEDKYLQMNKLITDLENFLVSRNEKLDVMELKRAELIQQAAKSVNIEDIDDLFYEPQTHNLMLSLLEELKQASNFKEIEQCIGYANGSQDSSFRLDSFQRSPKFDNNTNLDQNAVGEEAKKCREEAEVGDDDIVQEAQPTSLERMSEEKRTSPSRQSECCSVSSKKTKQEIMDESWGKFSNRMASSEGEVKGCDSVSQRRLQQRTVNPRMRIGVQGCIEWPRGIQRNLFKTKPLNARIESQKSQLRHILKHRVK